MSIITSIGINEEEDYHSESKIMIEFTSEDLEWLDNQENYFSQDIVFEKNIENKIENNFSYNSHNQKDSFTNCTLKIEDKDIFNRKCLKHQNKIKRKIVEIMELLQISK